MRPRQKTIRRRRYYLWVAVICMAYAGWAMARPLPDLQPEKSVAHLKLESPEGEFAWPVKAQAAIGIDETDIVHTYGAQKPVPIASTAKVITVLTVLDKKPLTLGQSGPELALGPKDVELYQRYLLAGGSVVPVKAGTSISELKAIEAVMLPSSNNHADSLAIWAFGSLQNYRTAANSYLKKHGLIDTRVGTDASGLSPTTTSTAHDLVKLGDLALDNPVLAKVFSQRTATGIPSVGTIQNVNRLLGTEGVIGIKTGQTDQAGGAFIGAARAMVDGKPFVVVTAILGSPHREVALDSTIPLVKSAKTNFSTAKLVEAGSVVGRYKLPWGGSVEAVTSQDLTATIWNGSTTKATIRLEKTSADSQGGAKVGRIEATAQPLNDKKSHLVILNQAPSLPSAWWRLTHPFN